MGRPSRLGVFALNNHRVMSVVGRSPIDMAQKGRIYGALIHLELYIEPGIPVRGSDLYDSALLGCGQARTDSSTKEMT
jgi:hypothetical protein